MVICYWNIKCTYLHTYTEPSLIFICRFQYKHTCKSFLFCFFYWTNPEEPLGTNNSMESFYKMLHISIVSVILPIQHDINMNTIENKHYVAIKLSKNVAMVLIKVSFNQVVLHLTTLSQLKNIPLLIYLMTFKMLVYCVFLLLLVEVNK